MGMFKKLSHMLRQSPKPSKADTSPKNNSPVSTAINRNSISTALAEAKADAPATNYRGSAKPSKLKVAREVLDDNSVVSLSKQVLDQLQLQRGDVVLVTGKLRRYTVLVAVNHDSDDGDAHINAVPCRNLGVTQGDIITVQRLDDVHFLDRVAFRPIDDTVRGLSTDLFDDFVQPYFTSAYRPVRKGDIFVVENKVGRVEFVVLEVSGSAEYGIVAADTVIHVGSPIPREEAEGPRKIGFDDIGGYQTELSRFREMIELALSHPEIFTSLGVQAPRGVLLHGPSGNGKSRLVRALATETGAFHFLIDRPTGLEQLQKAFEMAKTNKPALVEIDNIDLLAPKREASGTDTTFLSGLLAMLDELNRAQEWQVLIVSTTTRLDLVDMSLRRPGYFDEDIEIGLPDLASRLGILRIHLRKTVLTDDVNLEEIAAKCQGFSGANLVALCGAAAMEQVRHNMGRVLKDEEVDQDVMKSLRVGMSDLLTSVEKTKSRIGVAVAAVGDGNVEPAPTNGE